MKLMIKIQLRGTKIRISAYCLEKNISYMKEYSKVIETKLEIDHNSKLKENNYI